MKSAPRKWFLRSFRLSIVVGILNAAWYAWDVWTQHVVARNQLIRSQLVYECAARLDESYLRQFESPYGTFDVGKTLCTDREFWVSPKELQQVRAGTLSFKTSLRAFDRDGTMMMVVLGFLGTMLATSLIIGTVRLSLWIWGHSSSPS